MPKGLANSGPEGDPGQARPAQEADLGDELDQQALQSDVEYELKFAIDFGKDARLDQPGDESSNSWEYHENK